MAKTLNGGEAPDDRGEGDNGPERTREGFISYVHELDEAQSDLASALAACKEPRRRLKDIRKRAEEDGHNLVALDRALEDERKPASVREETSQQTIQNLIWLRKPVDFQAEMFDLDTGDYTPEELDRIETIGFAAGKAGERADSNPNEPGSEAFVRWMAGWTDGQAEKVAGLGGAPKRGRGRPRKNQAQAEA